MFKNREERSENAHQDQQRYTFKNDDQKDWMTHKKEWAKEIYFTDDMCNQCWDDEQAD